MSEIMLVGGVETLLIADTIDEEHAKKMLAERFSNRTFDPDEIEIVDEMEV